MTASERYQVLIASAEFLKLRYRAGRLIYLSTNDSLASLFPIADELPELHSHAKIMETIASGNIDRLLPLGSNAAQAAAQPLMAATKCATTTLVNFSAAEEQALAVFLINGVQVNRQNSESNKEESELIRFATSGVDSALMRSSDPFIQEIACLHGITDQPRHPELLETIFDEDENLAMDALLISFSSLYHLNED